MMQFIKHRCNTIQKLINTPCGYGVEIDIRSIGEQLILQHEPFVAGELFSSWIKNYKHNILILNVKEEGLEECLIEIMKANKIDNYFFLDQTFPFLVKLTNINEKRCAVRFSEFESIDTVLHFTGKANWVWIDCFTHCPLTKDYELLLNKAGFNLCLVSPELHGRNDDKDIYNLVDYIKNNNLVIQYVCTKRPELWEKLVK